MDPIVAAGLARLPALHQHGAAQDAPLCKVCGQTVDFFDVVDFNKCGGSQIDFYRFGRSGISIPYFRCRFCDFMFTDFFDDWTHDDFNRYVYNSDYAKVDPEYAISRPQRLVELMAAQLKGCETLRILDYGSGNGLFAEGMHRAGFQSVETFDPFSSPVRPIGRFDVITCFEVMEHAPDPHAILTDMAKYLDDCGCILFHTALQPPEIHQLRGNWWYVSPRNGHTSIYSLDALIELGRMHGLLFSEWSGRFAFRHPNPSNWNDAAIKAGLPFTVARLTAPLEGGNCAENIRSNVQEWHGIEQSPAGPARWTQAQEIGWEILKIESVPCKMRIVLPFMSEVRHGFASECRFVVDGRTVPIFLERGRLRGNADMRMTHDCTVKLQMPKPEQPHSQKDRKGTRFLGLRVPALLRSGGPKNAT